MKKKIICATLLTTSLLLGGCNKAEVKTYNVSFKGNTGLNHLNYIGENTASDDKNYQMSFNINYNYELALQDIHVYIDGREDATCWTFLYQTNEKNILTIDKSAIKGDIVIDAQARYRTSTPTEYGFLVDENYDITIKDGEEDKPVFIYYFSDHRSKKWIPTFDQYAYPVMEDDIIDFTIKLNDGVELTETYRLLLDNIWFRTNARFAKENVDFTRTFSSDHKECKIHVPHYIVRDHGSFRPNINNILGEDK